MKFLIPLFSLTAILAFSSCTKKSKEDPTQAADWKPQNASVAKHITSVHGFVIDAGENSHLQVSMEEQEVTAVFRDDVLNELGGEKALFAFGFDENPQIISRHEYLFFLEALHAYLVLNAPKWDGGENPNG